MSQRVAGCCCNKGDCDGTTLGTCCITSTGIPDPNCIGTCEGFDQFNVSVGSYETTDSDCSSNIGAIVGTNADGSDQIVARVVFTPNATCTELTCSCQENITCAECTRLKGKWQNSIPCTIACGGSCCIKNADGSDFGCVDVLNECQCKQAVLGNQTSVFSQGVNCAVTNCNPCTGNCNLLGYVYYWRITRIKVRAVSGKPGRTESFSRDYVFKQVRYDAEDFVARFCVNDPSCHQVRETPPDIFGNFYLETTDYSYVILEPVNHDCVSCNCYNDYVYDIEQYDAVVPASIIFPYCEGCSYGCSRSQEGFYNSGSANVGGKHSCSLSPNPCIGGLLGGWYYRDNNGGILPNCPVSTECSNKLDHIYKRELGVYVNLLICTAIDQPRTILTRYGSTCCYNSFPIFCY